MKFNKNYVVPITVLNQNPEIYSYADIPFRYVLGGTELVFRYEVSQEALKAIKRFETNITGVSLESIIYAELGVAKQDNLAFLIRNKKELEKIATIESDVREIPIGIAENGLIDALNDEDKSFVDEVNSVALALKNELRTTITFIKNNVFANEEILGQELVFSEDGKVLAICDLSSKSTVMEIKTVLPSCSNLGHLDSNIAYQLFYQANRRETYYLHIWIGGDSEKLGKEAPPRFCWISIYKVMLSEYSKEDYEEKLRELNWEEKAIFNFIKENPNCQYRDLEKAFPYCSRRMLARRIKSIETKKRIIRVGRKTYHWECVGD